MNVDLIEKLKDIIGSEFVSTHREERFFLFKGWGYNGAL